MLKYIDIHSHLDSEEYNTDIDAVLARMKEKELGTITIGAKLRTSKRAVEIAEANENIWACIGVHPGVCGKPEKAFFDEVEFEKLVKSPKVVGIGECGLEYFHIDKEETKNLQKKLFEDQIKFAIKHNKPLMLHVRDAYDDALDILNSYKKDPPAGGGEKLRGNVHFFAGDIEVAKKFLDLGFTMSFTGVITFTHDYDEVIKYVPQSSIMSETDAPWVAPVPFRGQRNEPAYVIEVVEKLAEIRGENFDTLNNAILQNAKRVFGV
jgi:TatD DNase family protein